MFNISNLNNLNKFNYMQPLKASMAVANNYVNSTASNPINTNYTATINTSLPINFGISQVRTVLASKEETKKYNEVASLVDKSAKKDLQQLLKTGKLLDNNSSDKSTTLDNLYKIATSKRIPGLSTKTILEDAIKTINDPFRITQKFGSIPVNMQGEIIQNSQAEGKPISAMDLDVKSSTCPAASVEFDLADRMPAEFARAAEGLTSENMSYARQINVNELSQGVLNTIWMLNEFGVNYKMQDWHTLNVNLKPDRNAIIRARVQATQGASDERSALDVLMQSTFMNIGSQNTYNTLTDKRTPKYNEDDSGLIDIEKNFVEELVTGKGKVCVTYQKIDDNGKLVGYECEPQETLMHIKNTLSQGNNVIIGYTYCDEENNVIGGHEITIIGIETDKNGNEYFVCNDTDDGIPSKITYPIAELLPKIHHAGIPKSVLDGNVEFVEAWKELMQVYKDTKAQQQLQQVQQMQYQPQYIPNPYSTPLTVIGQAA